MSYILYYIYFLPGTTLLCTPSSIFPSFSFSSSFFPASVFVSPSTDSKTLINLRYYRFIFIHIRNDL